MPYASASDVAAFCQNILGGQDNFTTSTCPTYSQVNAWLSSGCAIIETYLSGHGYSVPVAATATAYAWMINLNALYAAGRTEMSRSNVTLGPGERTRGQYFDERFWDELEKLGKLDLTSVGVGRSATGKLFVGGISISDKGTRDSDTDRVPPRFRRGQFAFPGTRSPDVLSAS